MKKTTLILAVMATLFMASCANTSETTTPAVTQVDTTAVCRSVDSTSNVDSSVSK